jgi:ribonucleoside-diphosphate reductase alpha chain
MENNALKLLRQRYFVTESDTWEKLVNRLVDRVLPGNTLTIPIKDDLYNRVWLPNSPALANCGKKRFGAFACFVVGPTLDTLEAHLEALSDIAIVCRAGGGCGFTGSYIRPAGSPVAGSTHGYAYGPNKYARAVSDWAHMMTQSGFRRMALMYTLASEHPDVEAFIDLKKSGNEADLYNFNQSVFASDLFMARATQDSDSNEHRLLRKIARNAWLDGEPGLLFADTINRLTPYTQYISATNPCGEQPLPPYGSCNLASINLNHAIFWKDNVFDFHALENIVRRMVCFMDALGTVNHFPHGKFATWYVANRPIGIGVMGFADALLRQEVLYGSPQSIQFLENVMRKIQETSYDVSAHLGKRAVDGIPIACQSVRRRNITTTTIAPTGSIAIIAGCSHGIEPIFSPSYTRTDERGESYLVEHPLAHEHFFSATIGSANTPTWKQHIDIQLAAQRYADSGISKTINFEETATEQDIFDAFCYAWKGGAKGLTVYRNNSRQKQVLSDNGHAKKILCSTCNVEMEKKEGCLTCPSCGAGACTI